MFAGGRNKYGAKRAEADGHTFASQRERDRYVHLRTLERLGKISGLVLQPSFRLVVAGKLVCTYRADFQYLENGACVVEDSKGFQTRDFKLKWKLVQQLYPQYTFRLT